MFNPNENLTMEQIFHKNLPHTLYQSHYELSKDYGFTPQEWRKFLRDNNIFIESELAAIAEAEARSALSRLGNASGQEVTALKAVLEKSKLINDAQRQATKIVLTFIPDAYKQKIFEQIQVPAPEQEAPVEVSSMPPEPEPEPEQPKLTQKQMDIYNNF